MATDAFEPGDRVKYFANFALPQPTLFNSYTSALILRDLTGTVHGPSFRKHRLTVLWDDGFTSEILPKYLAKVAP